MTKLRIKDLVVGDLYGYRIGGRDTWRLAYREEDIKTKLWDDIDELEDGWGKEPVLMYLARTVLPIKTSEGSCFRWTWYRFYSMSHRRNILLSGELVRTYIQPI